MLQVVVDHQRYVSLRAALASRYREIGQRNGAERWIGFAFETWLRLFLTIQFAIWAAFECDSWQAAGWLCGAGFVLDIVRNFTLEHLRLDPDGIRARMEALLQNGNRHRLEAWSMANRVFFFVLFIFVMKFITFGPKTEHAPVPGYIQAMLPLQELTWHLSTTMRHIMTSLLEHRYPNRATESGFFLMVSTWVTIGYTCVIGFGYGQELGYNAIKYGISLQKPSFMVKKFPKLLLCMTLLWSGPYVLINADNVDWINDDPLLGIHLFKNNYSFIEYSIIYTGFLTLNWLTYIILCTGNVRVTFLPQIAEENPKPTGGFQ